MLRWRLPESFSVKGRDRRTRESCDNAATCCLEKGASAHAFNLTIKKHIYSTFCDLDHCLSFSTVQHNSNALPFTKLNVDDSTTGRKRLSPRYVVVDRCRHIQQPYLISEHRRNIWGRTREGSILTCFPDRSIPSSLLAAAPSQRASPD